VAPETKAQGCAEHLIRGGGPCWLNDNAAGQFRLRNHLDSPLTIFECYGLLAMSKAGKHCWPIQYEQTAFAFKKLIYTYIDTKLAKKVFVRWIRDVNARPKYQTKQ